MQELHLNEALIRLLRQLISGPVLIQVKIPALKEDEFDRRYEISGHVPEGSVISKEDRDHFLSIIRRCRMVAHDRGSIRDELLFIQRALTNQISQATTCVVTLIAKHQSEFTRRQWKQIRSGPFQDELEALLMRYIQVSA